MAFHVDLQPPRYTLHRVSGQAVVQIAGRDHYLGVYGTSASHDLYALLIAEWRLALADRRITLQAATITPARGNRL